MNEIQPFVGAGAHGESAPDRDLREIEVSNRTQAAMLLRPLELWEPGRLA
jgi:hypothetical protein